MLFKLKLPNNQFVAFDLEGMKEIATIQRLNAKKIIGLDKELLIYLTPKNRLVLYNFRTSKQVNRLRIPKFKNEAGHETNGEVFNCSFPRRPGLYFLQRTHAHI